MRTLTITMLLGILLLVGPVPVHAVPVNFTAVLTGPGENPPNSSPAIGTALVSFDNAAHTLALGVVFTGLGSNTTAAHIHCCTTPPNNVGIATPAPAPTGFPLGVTFGAYLNTFDTLNSSTYSPAFLGANGGTAAGAEGALFAGLLAGQAYFNIHTANFQDGEIRGFFAQPTVTVPETASLLLLGAGWAGIGVWQWKNRKLMPV